MLSMFLIHLQHFSLSLIKMCYLEIEKVISEFMNALKYIIRNMCYFDEGSHKCKSLIEFNELSLIVDKAWEHEKCSRWGLCVCVDSLLVNIRRRLLTLPICHLSQIEWMEFIGSRKYRWEQ